jgi:D-threo-aldose 1-dehydrogenase
MKQVEENLKQLHRDKIDILFIHDPDRYGDPVNPGGYYPVFGKGMALETLKKLKKEGVIGAIGLASLWLDYQAYCVDRGGFDVILTFNRYGLLWRDAQFQIFPFCRKHQVGIIQGTPFHHGILSGPHREWVENPPEWMNHLEHERYSKLLEIHEQSGLSFAELALRFILENDDIGTVIQGAATVEELEANVACSDLGPLPQDISTKIVSLGIFHEDPRRMI